MKYYSQIGQDQYYIENIIKGKRNGTYLEIGANDGIHTSNTAALELMFGWSGILVEPNPILAELCRKNRPNSTVVECAVWKESTTVEMEVPHVTIKKTRGDLLSRISGLERNEGKFSRWFDQGYNKIKVPAKTVTTIIESYMNQPYFIDYMSLDTEGAELEGLMGVDFSKIDIKFMTVEWGNRNGYKEELIEYLKPFNYRVHRINKHDIEFEKLL
jgi:FkbM family methyltransferase